MTALTVQTGTTNEILRATSLKVDTFDEDLKKIVSDMKETLKKKKGLGIAAPQVGLNIRVFIFIQGYGTRKNKVREVINPEVLFVSEDKCLGEEGCLSIPGQFGNVYRPNETIVSFYDVDGNAHKERLEDLDARVFLHELDHLNGVLFVDRLEDSLIL